VEQRDRQRCAVLAKTLCLNVSKLRVLSRVFEMNHLALDRHPTDNRAAIESDRISRPIRAIFV
jgi:hypothetical protein